MKFTDKVNFLRIVLLAAAFAYAASFSADLVLHLGFVSFLVSSLVVSILLFSVFVISFFINARSNDYVMAMRIISICILFHLSGISAVNHFRPEMLTAILITVFVSGFLYIKIDSLLLFDLAVIAMVSGGFYLDYYLSEELLKQNLAVVKPWIDPLLFVLSVAGVMILGALINLIKIVQFKPKNESATKEETTSNEEVAQDVLKNEPVFILQNEIRDKPSSDFIDHSVIPVAYIGIDYRFAKVNDAFSELSGFSHSELSKLRLIDIIHPDDKESEKRTLSNIFSGRVPVNRSDKRIVKRNQQVVWVNISSSLVRDENGYPRFIVSVFENISRQKRHERTLIKEKVNLSSIVDHSDLFILNVDRNHTILFLNESLKDLLFGVTDIVVESGFNLKQIIPTFYLPQYEELFSRGLKGELFTKDINFEVSGSNMVDVEISVHPVVDDLNQVISMIISAKDIADRKKRERELLREKKEAESSTEAKSSFLATMSHEIRTPLNGVIGMGRLLSQTSLSAKQQDYVNSIMLSGEALLSVINDILDYSKIESERMEIENKPFALKRSIEETFELLSAKAIEKNLALQFSVQREVPRFIVGDITRIRQVLLNLVSNSIKFTSSGKINVHVSKFRQEGEMIELLFEVKDTGIGIPAEKIDRLFKSFSQADESTAKTYGGTGLGLAISKNLVTLMGGNVWVKSESGKGSSFFFTIRTKQAPAETVPDGTNGANQLANATLLLISDDKEEVNTYTNYFTRWGIKVRSTNDSNTAISLVKDNGGIDLIVIDNQMISAKAMTLAEKLRSIAPKNELPIILFNTGDEDITVEFTDKILSAVIPKNVDRSKLLDVLISVFAFEEHQRVRQQKGSASMSGKQLAREIPFRILIAEDNAVNQKLVANLFEGLGYKPDIVGNGLLVIEKLKAAEYDIIFMDVQMPELDGLETTKYIINKMDIAKRPVIVAMTAFALEGDREKCIEAGMDDYISKPFMIEEIVQRIRKWGSDNAASKADSAKSKANERSAENGDRQEGNDIPVFDGSVLDKLRELTSGNSDEFIRDIIKMFLKQVPQIVDEMINFFNQRRYTEMGQSAHKLKGSSLNVGAVALADICRKIELKGKTNEITGCDRLLEDLKTVYEKTVVELKNL